MLAALASCANTLFTTPRRDGKLNDTTAPGEKQGVKRMELQRSLIELEEAAQRITDGLTAIQVMTLALKKLFVCNFFNT